MSERERSDETYRKKGKREDSEREVMRETQARGEERESHAREVMRGGERVLRKK